MQRDILLMRKLNNLLYIQRAIVVVVIQFYSTQKCVPEDLRVHACFSVNSSWMSPKLLFS